MKYGELLKKLIIFTNTKIMVIANETGYDISYISKWCNKGILPTTRTISVINKKLSKVFANEIMTQDRLDDFFISFSDVIENTETNEEYSSGSDESRKRSHHHMDNRYLQIFPIPKRTGNGFKKPTKPDSMSGSAGSGRI